MNPRVAALGILILLTSLMVACSDSPTAPRTEAALDGFVHVAPTGPAIAGVSVSLQGQTTTSDVNGTFDFTGLTAGTETIMLTRQGFQPQTVQFLLRAGQNQISIDMTPLP